MAEPSSGASPPTAGAARIGVVVDGIWAFLAVTVVLSLSPGPDDVLVLRSSLSGGPRAGMATVAGVAAGSLAWGVATAAGLAAVVVGSAGAYEAVRLTGSGYLVVLGAAPLLADLRGRARAPAYRAPSHRRVRRPGLLQAFSAGLTSDLLSPKIGLFYLAVVPQFVPADAPALQYALLLCAIDVAVAVSWLAMLAGLARAAVDWLLRPAVVLWTQRVFSAVLVGLGVSTAVGL
ncbi:LysE family translocator [Blastococcus deserti]|uniref:LysE family translocator n=1 Tax=Blastococcus deserti TaxID=2259033 RepID=A0ABW4X6Y5_9ACTN